MGDIIMRRGRWGWVGCLEGLEWGKLGVLDMICEVLGSANAELRPQGGLTLSWAPLVVKGLIGSWTRGGQRSGMAGGGSWHLQNWGPYWAQGCHSLQVTVPEISREALAVWYPSEFRDESCLTKSRWAVNSVQRLWGISSACLGFW
jgi:hypothetical protein